MTTEYESLISVLKELETAAAQRRELLMGVRQQTPLERDKDAFRLRAQALDDFTLVCKTAIGVLKFKQTAIKEIQSHPGSPLNSYV